MRSVNPRRTSALPSVYRHDRLIASGPGAWHVGMNSLRLMFVCGGRPITLAAASAVSPALSDTVPAYTARARVVSPPNRSTLNSVPPTRPGSRSVTRHPSHDVGTQIEAELRDERLRCTVHVAARVGINRRGAADVDHMAAIAFHHAW